MDTKSEKFSLSVSQTDKKLYKIRLVKNIARMEETVFEFLTSRVPKTSDVVEIYLASLQK